MSEVPDNSPKARRQRADLVKALVEVCDERGYREATPTSIAARAGLERADFRRHFDTVEDCFLAIWDVAFEDIGEKLLDAYSGEDQWQARLRATAHELHRLLRKRSFPVVRVLTLNSDQAGMRAATRRDQFLRSFSALIDAGRYETEDPDSVPQETALALTAGIHHAVYARFSAGRESEFKEMIPELMCLIVTPYLGLEAGFAELEQAG